MNKRGLSLLEIILSMALLVLGLLGVLGIFIAVLPHLRTNKERAMAVSLARGLHEEIRAQNRLPEAPAHFQGSIPDLSVNEFPPVPYPSLKIAENTFVFEVRVNDGARSDVKEVVIEVRTGDKLVRQRGLYYAP